MLSAVSRRGMCALLTHCDCCLGFAYPQSKVTNLNRRRSAHTSGQDASVINTRSIIVMSNANGARASPGGDATTRPATAAPGAPDLWAPTTSTITKPMLRMEAYRGEAMLMCFIMVLVFVFEVSAVLVPVFHFRATSASGATTEVTIYHNKIRLCLTPATFATTAYVPTVSGSGCTDETLSNRLCDGMTSRLEAARAFAIVAILVSVLGCANCAFEVRGRAFLTPLMTYVIAITLWWLLFFHFVLDSAVFEERLCRGLSLKKIGFVYKAGWVLGFVAWLFLSIALLAYFIRRHMRPLKYTYNAS